MVTDGNARLVVMEALKCPLPSLNNGEDNAVFKSLIGTLIKCPGPGHCADPLFCKAGFFQVTVPQSSKQTEETELPDWIDHANFTRQKCPLRMTRKTHADNAAPTVSCRLQWKARRAQIACLASQAAHLSEKAQRIPVLADTTLLRTFPGGIGGRTARRNSAAQHVHTPPTWRLLLCLNQMWMKKSGQAFPCYARRVLDCLGHSIHHPHQISLAEFSAYHLGQIIYHLDMLAIARTTKLTATSKEKVEDETTEEAKTAAPLVETEFHGGEQGDEPADEDVVGGSWRPISLFSHDKLTAILSRESEVAAARKKGRKSMAVIQMKAFDDIFHTVLNTPVPASTAKPQKAQLSYSMPQLSDAALLYQDAIVKEMRLVQNGNAMEVNPESEIGKAVLHNLQPKNRAAEWIDLPTALKGPAYVAKALIRKLENDRSQSGKLYRLNEEQLQCTALFVGALEKAFANREDLSKPWLHPARVLMTIVTDGGGGCGKTTLAVEVILPLLETYFHPEGVLRRAPSNKPARLIGGRTMHSGQGLTPENSMRTASLALNAQSKHKLSITHAEAGVLHIDEASQLQAELNHAAALRTTYAREYAHKLDRNIYSQPDQRYGKIAILWYQEDHLQLPPVPESSSMLAPMEGTSDEHKAGASIFRNAELVFQFNTAMRFTDETLIQILEAMRTKGGKKLKDAQWKALLQTQRSADKPEGVIAERLDEANCYHVCYCWSVITMAAFMLARLSARKAGQTLFYAQAVDQPLTLIERASQDEFLADLLKIPSLSATKRLPAAVLWHVGMRMKFTTTLQQPFAVQDVECTVVGFEPDDIDHEAKAAQNATGCQGEHVCAYLPKACNILMGSSV